MNPAQIPLSNPTLATSQRKAIFADAVVLAAERQVGQVRKDTHISYVDHVLAVVGIVLEQGGDEDQATAAFLHDAWKIAERSTR